MAVGLPFARKNHAAVMPSFVSAYVSFMNPDLALQLRTYSGLISWHAAMRNSFASAVFSAEAESDRIP